MGRSWPRGGQKHRTGKSVYQRDRCDPSLYDVMPEGTTRAVIRGAKILVSEPVEL